MLCFALDPGSALHHFMPADPDDYMRLTQVANFLSGQAWHDFSQPRLSPGDATVVYWSRLADLPLAGVASILRLLMPLEEALKGAALAVPLLLLGFGLLPLASHLARPFLPRRSARAAALLVLFMPQVLFQFSPGRADHHAYQVLVSGVAFLCLARMIASLRAWRPAVLASLALSLGLWIGGEGVLTLIMFSAALAFASAWLGGRAMSHAALFGFCLGVFSALVLPLARSADEWGRLDITWFSTAYVLFAALTGLVFVAGWLLGRGTDKRQLRVLLFLALACFNGALFFFFAPKALSGPYADMTAPNVSIILGHVMEARSVLHYLRQDVFDAAGWGRFAAAFLLYAFIPSVCFGVVLWNLFRSRGRRRVLWLSAGLFILVPFLMALFWQKRVFVFAQFFALVPLAWLMARWWTAVHLHDYGPPRPFFRARAFVLCGLAPAVFVYVFAAHAPLKSGLRMFPLARAADHCSFDAVEVVLDDPAGLGKRPRVIMNVMDNGPEILFRTKHAVLSAPYNADGNRDSVDFFSARDEKKALSILIRRKADLVLFCRYISPFYAGLDRAAIFRAPLVQDAKGGLHIRSDPKRLTMIERMLNNKAPPWLKRVEIALDSGYLLYEIDKASFSEERQAHEP